MAPKTPHSWKQKKDIPPPKKSPWNLPMFCKSRHFDEKDTAFQLGSKNLGVPQWKVVQSCWWQTRNPGSTHQLRLVVYPIICGVLYVPGGCLEFLNHQQYPGGQAYWWICCLISRNVWWTSPRYIATRWGWIYCLLRLVVAESKPRWWFQIYLLCSSLFGEDSHSD